MKQIPFIAPRDRTIRDRLIALLIVFAVLVVGSIGYNIYLISAHKSSTSEPLPITGIGVTNKPNGDVIGISDGSYAFDTRRADGDLKLQASEKLRNGDKSGAILQWQDVVKKETNDAEALIYLEDQNVLRSGKPYITLIVGTMLTGNNASAVSTGLDTLQGAYVAQKEYNDGSKLQGGNLLRLLIANSGSQVSYTTAVAQQITAAAKYDKTILGIIGWSFSDNAYNAVKVLEQVHLPMVSPTASADTLTHISPYFFRVVPSNKSQAIAGALYIEQQMQATKVALFLDPNNPYSNSLANDFSAKYQNDGNKIVATEEYQVGETGNFQLLLQDALSKNPNVIYFAGYAADLSKLLTLQPDIEVMGGDALYQLGGYSAEARAGFRHLHFTAFAYPDEWEAQKLTPPQFFASYGHDFNPLNQPHDNPYSFSRPAGDVMLAYDATLALLQGANNTLATGKTALTPDDLRQGLTQIRGDKALQGVSGQISFAENGDPINKAIVVLYVASGYIKVIDQHGVQGCFQVGQCSNTDG